MNEQNLYDEMYRKAVADKEKIRRNVLKSAHATEYSAPKKSSHWVKYAALPIAACAAFVVMVNSSMTFAYAISDIPVLSAVAELVTVRQWDFTDKSVDIHGQQPAIENSGALAEKINPMIDEKLSALDAAAKADSEEYRKNWIAMGNDEREFVPIQYNFTYETYCASDTVLSFVIRQEETVTTNTADTYTTLFYYNLNAADGSDITLEQLLGADWKETVAISVDAAIRSSGDEGMISYYQEFWVDKNVPIDDSQKFYINEDGSITVVFDEGYAAPFESGPQSFKINA